MDNDQIQQTNLVSDDAVATMTDAPQPEVVQPVQPSSDPADNTSVASEPAPASSSAPDSAPAEPTPKPTSDFSELDDIKKSALDELQPLIKHVEQSPEERFETVMMMIRSNDDPSLISQAYEAAKGIENEKTRANALLNIVSEIEYLKSKAN